MGHTLARHLPTPSQEEQGAKADRNIFVASLAPPCTTRGPSSVPGLKANCVLLSQQRFKRKIKTRQAVTRYH